jgi:DNA polymerase-3 subunit alpha
MVTDLEWDTASALPTLGLLGLKALTVLRRTCGRVRQAKSIEVPIDHLPLDDEKTFALLQSGETDGIFQLETDRMRRLCRKLQPGCFGQIVALVALHQPELADRLTDFVKRRHGKAAPEYGHPLLEAISQETYGMLVYQEQFMQAVQILGGFTLGGADLLRRARGQSRHDEVAQHRKDFVKGARERNGIPATRANQIFDSLVEFAGCNKSHAAAHATLAYQTAYLKANHPAEFLGATIGTNVTRRVQHGHESVGVG